MCLCGLCVIECAMLSDVLLLIVCACVGLFKTNVFVCLMCG